MAFGLICRLQLHALIGKDQAEVVGFSGFGFEVHGFSDALGGFLEGSRLPLGAEIVLAGFELKKEVRLAVVRSHPISVDSEAHGGRIEKIDKKVHQRFAWFGLANRML